MTNGEGDLLTKIFMNSALQFGNKPRGKFSFQPPYMLITCSLSHQAAHCVATARIGIKREAVPQRSSYTHFTLQDLHGDKRGDVFSTVPADMHPPQSERTWESAVVDPSPGGNVL